MYRVLLWGTGKCFTMNTQLIKYYESLGEIQVVGVTSGDKMYHEIFDWKFYHKESINVDIVDIVILMLEKPIPELITEITKYGFQEERIIDIRVLKLPGFVFSDYLSIKRFTPTIFCPMCWGGVTYHSLALEFKSPFINMFLLEEDYMHFLENPMHYIRTEIEFDRLGWSQIMNRSYPIAKCDDIELHFNHYDSFEKAQYDWNRRKARINWNNILVMMFTNNIHVAERFLCLNYDKMVLFSSLDINDNRVVRINIKDEFETDMDLWTAVNETAKGRYLKYNVLELMKNGIVDYLSC